MSEMSLMSPDEETAAAVRIARLRTEYWKVLLGYAPYVEAMADRIERELEPEELPKAELAGLRRAARSVRDRKSTRTAAALAAAVESVASVVSYVDVDGILCDKLAADLETLHAGHRRGLGMAVRPPRVGSRAFHAYVLRVRQASAALRAAKHAFVKKNLRLVVSIARRFNHGRMPLPDLIQEGNIGLLKAVDRFDHRRGFRFSTYGSWWIRHAISRAIADKARAIRLPVHMLDAHHRVARAKRDLEAVSGESPTLEQLAERTGIVASKIERMDMAVLEAPISLDRPIGGDDDRTVVDLLADHLHEEPAEQMAAEGLQEQVRQVILGLRPIEADILRKRFGLVDDQELTLKEIGAQYALSRERIRQLQEQALLKLRRELQRRDAV
jgi:RNA polymerase primary sigma factor